MKFKPRSCVYGLDKQQHIFKIVTYFPSGGTRAPCLASSYLLHQLHGHKERFDLSALS